MAESSDNRLYCRWELTQVNYEGTLLSEPKILMKGDSKIGRAKNNAVQSFSPMSSRHQCVITLEEDGFVLLRDLGSLNGTYVGSERVKADRALSLNDDDVIGFGVNPLDERDNVQSAVFRLRRKILDKDDIVFFDKNCVVPVRVSRKSTSPQSIIIIDDDDEEQIREESTSTNVDVEPVPSTSKGITGNSSLPVIETIDIDDENEITELEIVGRDSRSGESERTLGKNVSDCHKEGNKTKIGRFEVSKPDSTIEIIDISEINEIENRNHNEENLEKVACEVLSDDEIEDLSGKEDYQVLSKSGCSNNCNMTNSDKKSNNLEKFISNSISKDISNEKLDHALISSTINSPENKCCKSSFYSDGIIPDLTKNISKKDFETTPNKVNDVMKAPVITNLVAKIEAEESKKTNIVSSKLDNKLDQSNNLKVDAIVEKCIIDKHEENLHPNNQVSDVDETIKGIYKRRLSDKSASFEKPSETDSVNKIPEVSIISESFTADDDDIICLDDDSDLPCSQMFQIKPEMPNEENIQNLEEDCIYEEDDVSDTDSTDEWFQRLSQSCSTEKDFDIEELGADAIEDKEEDLKDDKQSEEEVNQILRSEENDVSDEDKQGSADNKTKMVHDNILEDDFSEPLFRKSTSGSKRKLPIFSDDDDEDDEVDEGNNTLVTEPVLKGKESVNKLKASIKNKSSTKYPKPALSKKSKTTLNDGNTSSSETSTVKFNDIIRIHSYDEVDKHDVSRVTDETTTRKESANNKNLEIEQKSSTDDLKKVEQVNESKSSSDVSARSCNNNLIEVDLFGEGQLDMKKSKGSNTARKRTSGQTYRKTKQFKRDSKERDYDTAIADTELSVGLESNEDDLRTKIVEDRSKRHWQDYVNAIVTKINEIEQATKKANCQSPDLPNGHLKSDVSEINKKQTVSNEEDNLELIKEQSEVNDPETQNLLLNSSSNIHGTVSKESMNDENKIIPDKSFKSIKTSQEMSPSSSKLDAISKKIGASHKKKAVEIIDAKSLPVRRKSSAVTEEKGLSENKEENIPSTSEKWISKDQPQMKPHLKVSKADRKAIIKDRKAKLHDLAMKDSAVPTIEEEKPKVVTTAKNTTKNTSKSRNEILLDTLVSKDNATKEKSQSVDNVQDKKKLSSFKIPRRNSSADTIEQVSSVDASSSSNTQAEVPQPSTSTNNKSNTIENINTEIPIVNQFHDPVLEVLTDKILNAAKNKLKPRVSRMPTISLAGVENEEPIKVILVPNTIQPHQPKWNMSSIRGVMKKYDENVKENKTKKRVHFNQSGDDSNVVYVIQQEFEVALGSMLRPVTQQVTKHERPPVKHAIRAPYTNYEDELIYQICKWNTRWFQEKNTVKGEPNVFDGQIYHLKNEFLSYSDYRRGFYPLLLYQLWQVLARQHDLVEKKNKLYNFEIKNVTRSPVQNRFTFLQNQDDTKVLWTMESQMLLERDSHVYLPRMGDVVVLDGKIVDSNNCKHTVRKLCYLVSNTTRPIASHRDVSPRLKSQSPLASQVMDFILKTRTCGASIDKTEPFKFAVLKNLNSELRMFRALDQLPASPLVNMICNPKENNVPLPPISFKDICKQNLALNTSQKRAVLYVARSCMSEAPVIHLIHGPPGCGKSEVITGIFQQMWSDSYRTQARQPQILLCAPSNAAVDELVTRLANIRHAMPKKKFFMVRVGRADMVNKNVAMWTLEKLVEGELKLARELTEDEELRNVEVKTLEAKVNQLTYQLDNLGIKKNDKAYINYLETKLAEAIKRHKDFTSGKVGKTLEGKELREKKKEIEQGMLEKANIIATTLSSCFNSEMAHMFQKGKLRLTCCIVDEATQCTEPETLIPLMLGVTKLVLVGDPQQLPATVLSPMAKEHGLDRSLFARHQECWNNLVKEQPDMKPFFESRCHFLNTQYRMDPSIIQWPSDHFYKGRVMSHVGLELRMPNCPLMPYLVLSHEFSQSKHEESNMKEGQMLINIVRSIVRSGKCDGMDIGIITPYNRQKDLIKREISGEAFSRMVEVGTVDSYQGRERDIILLSCVRTEGIGFMADCERLNVALTRAKFSLIICGNFVSLQNNPTWASLLTNARNRRLIRTLSHSDLSHDIFHKVCKPIS